MNKENKILPITENFYGVLPVSIGLHAGHLDFDKPFRAVIKRAVRLKDITRSDFMTVKTVELNVLHPEFDIAEHLNKKAPLMGEYGIPFIDPKLKVSERLKRFGSVRTDRVCCELSNFTLTESNIGLNLEADILLTGSRKQDALSLLKMGKLSLGLRVFGHKTFDESFKMPFMNVENIVTLDAFIAG